MGQAPRAGAEPVLPGPSCGMHEGPTPGSGKAARAALVAALDAPVRQCEWGVGPLLKAHFTDP